MSDTLTTGNVSCFPAIQSSILDLTAEMCGAYFANNAVDSSMVSQVITNVYETLSSLAKGGVSAEKPVEKPVPAVSVKKSITDEHIICLEDGKKLKMLKRHLQTHYGLSPDEYRARWGLPKDYPMVAPGYAQMRSKLAEQIGLGRRKAA